jgi:hypothetical protein
VTSDGPRPLIPSAAPPEAGRSRATTYKVVEVSPVADETLERALNEWTGKGLAFESMHFVMREGSHRPALAYLFFVGRAG